MEQDDRAGRASVIAEELDGSAVMCVVCEVEADLVRVVRGCGHGGCCCVADAGVWVGWVEMGIRLEPAPCTADFVVQGRVSAGPR